MPMSRGRGLIGLLLAVLLSVSGAYLLPADQARAAELEGCSTGTGGPKADALCWLDLTGFGTATVAEIEAGVSRNLTLHVGADTLTLTVEIKSAVGGSAGMSAVPFGSGIWARAVMGNTIAGTDYFLGTTGSPALYQATGGAAGARETVTVKNISVTDSGGTAITNYTLVMTDAESTNGGEGFVWKSDKALSQLQQVIPSSGNKYNNTYTNEAYGQPCNSVLSGLGTTTVTCASTVINDGRGAEGSSAARGIEMVSAKGPSWVSAQITGKGGSGRQGLAFAVSVPAQARPGTKTVDQGATATISPSVIAGLDPVASTTFADGSTTKVVPGEGSWAISLVSGQPKATFTPDAGFTGPVTTQTYRITDSSGNTATSTLDVVIKPATGNDSKTINPGATAHLAPVATPGSAPLTGVVFDNGSTTKVVAGEGNWTISLDGSGQPKATFTPDAGYSGSVTSQPYTVTDNNGNTATGNLSVNINKPPATGDDSKTINPGQTAHLAPVATPGSAPLTAVAFDNGSTTKVVAGEGTWAISLVSGQPKATFTPDAGYSASVTSQAYTVTDNNGNTATGNLSVAINTPPATGPDTVTVDQGATAHLAPVATPGSAPLTAVAFDNGSTTKVVAGEGTWAISLVSGQPKATFTPDAGFTGPVTQQPYTVTDNNGLTATSTLDVVIKPATSNDSKTINPGETANLAPVATPGSAPLAGVVFDNGSTTKVVAGEGSWAISLVSGQPKATFTPDAGYTGSVTTQPYTVTDSNGLTASGNLSVDINKPPATGDDSKTINPGQTANLAPVATPGSAPLTGVVFDNGSTTKVVAGEGNWAISLVSGQPKATFTPDAGYSGSVTTQPYTVIDGNGLTASGNLSVDINAAPATGPDTVTVDQGATAHLAPVATPGSGSLTAVAFDNGSTTKVVAGEGTWAISLDGSGQPKATFTPDAGFTGPVTQQSYTVTDSNGLTATSTLDVVIKPATGDDSKTINPGETAYLAPVATPGSAPLNAVTFDNGATLKAVAGEGTWTISLVSGQPKATFTPDAGYSGSVTSQAYTVTDDNGNTATGNLSVDINTPLATGPDTVTVDQGETAHLAPVATPGSGSLTAVAFDNGSTTKVVAGEGTWAISLDGSGQPKATFTPDAGFTGPVTQQPYTVTDNNGLTATSTLDVVIKPATSNDSKTINPGETANLAPVATPGSAPLTAVAFDNGSTTKVVAGEGSWAISLVGGQPKATFTPDAGFTGSVTTQPYTVTDSNGLTASGNLSVDINKPPATGDDSKTINPGQTANLAPVATPGSAPLTGVVFDNGSTTKVVAGEGSWTISLVSGQPKATFTPDAGYSGSVNSQPYTVIDGNGLTASGNLSVDINKPPATGDDSKTINPGQTAHLAPVATPGSAPLTGVVFDNGSTTKVVAGEGSWAISLVSGQPKATFTPDAGYSGSVTSQPYTVTDKNGLTASGNLSVDINKPPATGDDSKIINPGDVANLAPVAVPGSAPLTGVVFDNGSTTKVVPGEGSWAISLVSGQPKATFTPDAGYSGSVTSQPYTVIDGNGLTASGNLSVDINMPPATGDDSKTIDPGETAHLAPVATPGSAPLTGVVFDNGSTTKVVPGEGSWAISLVSGQPKATFTPDAGYSGSVTSQPYTVIDGNGLTASGNLSVDINKPPATGDDSKTINPGDVANLAPVATPGSAPLTGVVFDNGSITKVVAGEGSWAISLVSGQPKATFTPDAGYSGSVTTQPYTVTDKNGLTATGNLSVAINMPPATGSERVTVGQGATANLAPVATPGSGPLTAVVFDNGSTTKVVAGEGTWAISLVSGQPKATFTPDAGFTGPVTQQSYTVTDSNGLTATSTLDVVIKPATGNDSKTINPGETAKLAPVATPGSGPLAAVAFDDGSTTKVVPGEGTWTISLDGSGQPKATFAPICLAAKAASGVRPHVVVCANPYHGDVTPQAYTVTDDNGLTATGELSVLINDPPMAAPQVTTVEQGQQATLHPGTTLGSGPLVSVVFDNGLTTKVVPGEGTWQIGLDGSGHVVATFTPLPGFDGKVTSQSYTVTDENGLTATSVLGVTMDLSGGYLADTGVSAGLWLLAGVGALLAAAGLVLAGIGRRRALRGSRAE
jgi:CshA-type fibril repeat protein